MAIHNTRKSEDVHVAMRIIVAMGIVAAVVIVATVLNTALNLWSHTAPAALTAEQQVLLQKLNQVRQGDIVLDPTGTVIDQNTTVLLVTSLAAVRYDCFLRGINTSSSRAFSFEELARHNCRVIPSESEEWHTTLRAELTK